MEVKVTETQQKILMEVQVAKKTIENEFAKLTQKETELITMVAESAGVKLAPGSSVELKDGALVFNAPEDKPVKKLKKAE